MIWRVWFKSDLPKEARHKKKKNGATRGCATAEAISSMVKGGYHIMKNLPLFPPTYILMMYIRTEKI